MISLEQVLKFENSHPGFTGIVHHQSLILISLPYENAVIFLNVLRLCSTEVLNKNQFNTVK